MYVAAFLLPALSCAETKRERATAASVLSIAFAARRIYMASAGDGRCQRDAVSKACDRCKAASRDGKTCHSRRGWKWTVDLKENDALTDLPGMPLVRGVDALTAPGVRVVASFNQSNWPGILSELAPGLVRAASDQHKKQLCNVWKKEHSYQSWPVLLGCPGVRATEYEPACANVGGVVAIDCGSIDLSADPTLTGAVFDDRRWFRVTHSQGPPSVCAMKKTETLRGSIGVALSVYPTAVGHFVPEQLPNLLLLNAHLPPNVPILVGEDKVTRRYLTPLVDSGFVPADRFRYRSLASDGTVLQADTVYTVELTSPTS